MYTQYLTTVVYVRFIIGKFLLFVFFFMGMRFVLFWFFPICHNWKHIIINNTEYTIRLRISIVRWVHILIIYKDKLNPRRSQNMNLRKLKDDCQRWGVVADVSKSKRTVGAQYLIDFVIVTVQVLAIFLHHRYSSNIRETRIICMDIYIYII